MGNIIASLKKFVSDKNTVTILGVFVGIIVLYIGYNYRVNQKVKLVDVLYAKETINSNTQITSEKIGTMKVNMDVVRKSPNIVQNISQITDGNNELYFVNFDSTIPANSFIYKDALVSKDDKPDSKLKKVPEGYRYLRMDVDLSSTLGNAISPNSSIDIYAYISGGSSSKMFGKLYSNVKVVDVVDSSWATTSGTKDKNPDLLIVLVSEEDYRFLEKAKRISGIELIPAPNNKDFDDMESGTEISSYDLQMFIESQYTTVSDD